MRRILVDAGAMIALANENDDHHQSAVQVVDGLLKEGAFSFTTNFLIAEAFTLIQRKASAELARSWLNTFDLPIIRVTPDDEERARKILNTRTGPQSEHYHAFSYFDATSFAVMERLGCDTAFAFDRHFRLQGWQVLGL